MKKVVFVLLAVALICVFCASDGIAQQPSGKVYWMSTVTVPLGKMQDYLAFSAKELVPEQEKHGYRFVAGWQTIVGDIEEVVVVAEFENMDAYQKARAGLMASAEWKSMGAKLEGLSRGVHTRMMASLPFIKMK